MGDLPGSKKGPTRVGQSSPLRDSSPKLMDSAPAVGPKVKPASEGLGRDTGPGSERGGRSGVEPGLPCTPHRQLAGVRKKNGPTKGCRENAVLPLHHVSCDTPGVEPGPSP